MSIDESLYEEHKNYELRAPFQNNTSEKDHILCSMFIDSGKITDHWIQE